jgi:nucleoside-diphosphate kinase
LGNKTLAILKPDAVEKKVTGQIIARIQEAGFTIMGIKMTKLTDSTATGFYEIHKDKPFFGELLGYMTSGPCIPIALIKENAVEDFRKLIGATDPQKADEGTIRKDFAESITKNIVHGSDSDENAEKEIAYFFSRSELIQNRGLNCC